MGPKETITSAPERLYSEVFLFLYSKYIFLIDIDKSVLHLCRITTNLNVMKITIQDNTMIYTCDYSVNDKMDRGFLTEYYPSCKEAVDDALELLSCLYGRERGWQLSPD